jgi:hypothetical protein
MKQQITIHREDLEAIVRLIDQLNPPDDMKIGAGYATIYCDTSSGIGSLIDAEVVTEVNGIYGMFKQRIVDESSW